MTVAIKIENLSKHYRLGTISTRTLSHDLNRWWQSGILGKEDPYLKIGESGDLTRAPLRPDSTDKQGSTSDETYKVRRANDYTWALRDINLEVQQGEVLGIIGKNGAGKSTLLKILSKVTAPTTGTIKAKGRIGSLLEVGTGFHHEMTGRENIYMNGAIMGMTKAEITRKLDKIVDFAGIERYIDTPVKRYSSGMMVRLGFAVAAHLEPEILVVDEVLAVGDAEFQEKALGKMEEVSKETGRTILFVSHNMAAIRQICSRAILLCNGLLTGNGETVKIIEKYIASNISETSNWERKSPLNPLASFIQAGVVDHKGEYVWGVYNTRNESFFFHFNVHVAARTFNGTFAFEVINQMGQSVFCSHDYDQQTRVTQPGSYLFDIPVPDFLRTGHYYVTLGSNLVGLSTLEYIPRAFGFEYIDEINTGQLSHRPGILFVPLKWECRQTASNGEY
jgi:lipopolysaccharide transport system ATP-binding protein